MIEFKKKNTSKYIERSNLAFFRFELRSSVHYV